MKKPSTDDESGPVAPKQETEADREAKRLEQAHAIIPEGSKCLPTSLKEEGAPRLELAAAGADALLCAEDQDESRLLGSVGCWKVDLATGALEYREPQMLPGRGVSVMLDDRCARGYCLPAEAKVSGKVARMAKSVDGAKVAVLVGDDVHLFNAESKAHESTFSIRGDKGVTNEPTAIHYVDNAIVVEGADEGPFSSVWIFKTDGTAMGPVTSLGGGDKQLSTYKGSVSILDKTRIGVAERGMEVMTTYQVDNGARAKLVRKVPKYACKPAELDAYWHGGDKVTDKCKDSIEKASGPLMGATAVAGAKNFLVLLRGSRLGELGVLDSKSLAEKKAIKLPWCEGGGAASAEKADGEEAKPAKAAAKKPATKGDATSDPEEGGE